MVARGWISRSEVETELFVAAAANGLNADDGENATEKTIQSGLDNGEKHPRRDLDASQHEGFIDPPSAVRSRWKYHTGMAPTPLRWLIKGMLPETGAALVAGQWGTFKTTVALDVSVCVMADLLFAGLYRVKRRGAVLYIALEGDGTLSARLAAIAAHHGVSGPACRSPGAVTARRSRTKTPPPSYVPWRTRRRPISTAILVCRWC